MLIFYVDESGHHALKADPQNPDRLAHGSSDYFVLAAVGARDSTRKSLAAEITRVKLKHFGALATDGAWGETEIKGRYIALSKRRFHLISPDTQPLPSGYELFTEQAQILDFENDLRLIFARYRPIIFTICIDKRRLVGANGMDALNSAYAFLYRRVALTLQNVFQGEGGVFVADQQAEHERHFDSGDLLAFVGKMNQKGKRRAEYELILDKPLWIDTNQSSWDREIIQLADIAAYGAMECLTGRTSGGFSSLWGEIYRCLGVDPKTGRPEGEGIVIYPETLQWPELQPI